MINLNKYFFSVLTVLVIVSYLPSKAQIQLTATGTGNIFNVNYPANITTISPGMMVTFFSNQTISGASSLILNGLGPQSILKNLNQPLVSGDILAGQPITVIFDGTNWQLLSTTNSNGIVSGTTGGVAFFSNNTTLTTNSANFFWDNTNRRLGLGTSAPSSVLTIPAVVGNEIELPSSGSNADIVSNGQLNIGSTGSTVNLLTNSSYRITIATTGEVGIGTTNPGNKLHVAGGIRSQNLTTSGPVFANSSGDLYINTVTSNFWTTSGNTSDSTANYIGTNNNQPLIMSTNGTERMRISRAGRFGFNMNPTAGSMFNIKSMGSGAILSVVRSTDAGALIDLTETGGGNARIDMYNAALGNVVQIPSGPGNIFFAGGGNLGVNTTAPGNTFHVSGGARIGNLTNAGIVFSDSNGDLYTSSTSGIISGGGTIGQVAWFANTSSVTSSNNLSFTSSKSQLIVGINNNNSAPTNYGLVIGQANTIAGGRSFVSGVSNTVNNSQTAALGEGLFSNGRSGMVVGGYNPNVPVALNSFNNAFEVGIGTAPSNSIFGLVVKFLGISPGIVGIGTDNPQNTLDVVGGARIANLSTSGPVFANNLGDLYINTVAGIGGGGTVGGVAFWSNNTTLAANGANFFWDNTNSRLGIGTNNPGYQFDQRVSDIVGRENLARYRVSDAPGELLLRNASALATEFIPQIFGNQIGLGSALILSGESNNDSNVNDPEVVVVNGALSGGAVLGFKPLFAVKNGGSTRFQVAANGGVTIASLTSTGINLVQANAQGRLSLVTSSSLNIWTISGTNIFPQDLQTNIGIGLGSISTPGLVAGASRYLTLAANQTNTFGYPSFEMLSVNTSTVNTPMSRFDFVNVLTPFSTRSNHARIAAFTGKSVLGHGQLGFYTSNGALNEVMRLSENAGMSIGINYAPLVPPGNGLIIQGSVGIGTSVAGNNLHVAGGVRVTNLAGPGPVFANTTGDLFLNTLTGISGAGTSGGVAFWDSNNTLTADGANFYWNNTTNRLGIGNTNPQVKLHISAESTGNNANLILESSETGAPQGPGMSLLRAKGTLAVPLAVVNGDYLGGVAANGRTATQYNLSSNINFEVDAAVAGNSVPGRIVFSTTSSTGTLPSERMRINSDGNVGIGITPLARLHLKGYGNTAATDAFFVQNSVNTLLFNIQDDGNVGIGTNAPNAKLDINGGLILESAGVMTPGAYTVSPLPLNDYSYIQCPATGSVQIGNIGSGTDGQILFIMYPAANTGGNILTIVNNDTNAPVGNRIITTTNANLASDANAGASAILMYSGQASRWIVVSWQP